MEHNRKYILAPFAVFIATIVCTSPALASGEIIVAAQETEASVTPRAPRLRLVNLPVLEFSLRAAIRCKGETVSVTLSVADTVTTLRGEEFDDQWSAEETLTVPASQLALAASSRFCIANDGESTDELLVRGFTTAHASLRCAGEQGESVHFSSTPLQVRLTCMREPEDPQEPSSGSEDK